MEATLTVEDFRKADEIFVTGNIAKVMPVARLRGPRCPPARLRRGRANSTGITRIRAAPRPKPFREQEDECPTCPTRCACRDQRARRPRGAARGHRPVPVPGEGQILIRNAYAGVNRPDVAQRAGTYAPPPGASDLPGLEAAGEVAAVGPGVTRWRWATQVTRCCRAAATPNIR
jgi:hypothetical protein